VSRRLLTGFGLAAFLLIIAAASTLYVLPQAEAALVIRLGSPRAIVTDPGLHVKLPVLDALVIYDMRLLALEGRPDQIILGDQKRTEVQTYTRYRIADPLAFYRASRTPEQGRSQLEQIVGSAVRREFGRVRLATLLSEDRAQVLEAVRRTAADRAESLGIAVVDVRLRRADLPRETSEAIYARMKSEREREAKELRAQGAEWAQTIQSRAERERTTLLAEAQGHARRVRAEGDATANALYAQAANEAPAFFNFYRSLQTYRQALAEAHPTLVLSGDLQILDLLKAGPKLRDPEEVEPTQAAH